MFSTILKNKDRADELADVGYVKIPFLNGSEVNRLKRFYAANPPDMKAAFHSTPLSTDIAYRRSVNEVIQETFARALKDNFSDDYRYFFGAFTVKEPGVGSEWDLHQDWTFINEKKHYSIGVWVPLLDVDDHNGCLSVVKRSHRFIDTIRGTNTFSEYSETSEVIKDEFLTPIPMKAGEAALFLNSLLHYSPPNHSELARISVNCLMFPQEAQPVHHYRKNSWDKNLVEKLEISTETMLTHNFRDAERPKNAKSMGRFNLTPVSLSEKAFRDLYSGYNGNMLQRSVRFLKEAAK